MTDNNSRRHGIIIVSRVRLLETIELLLISNDVVVSDDEDKDQDSQHVSHDSKMNVGNHD